MDNELKTNLDMPEMEELNDEEMDELGEDIPEIDAPKEESKPANELTKEERFKLKSKLRFLINRYNLKIDKVDEHTQEVYQIRPNKKYKKDIEIIRELLKK